MESVEPDESESPDARAAEGASGNQGGSKLLDQARKQLRDSPQLSQYAGGAPWKVQPRKQEEKRGSELRKTLLAEISSQTDGDEGGGTSPGVVSKRQIARLVLDTSTLADTSLRMKQACTRATRLISEVEKAHTSDTSMRDVIERYESVRASGTRVMLVKETEDQEGNEDNPKHRPRPPSERRSVAVPRSEAGNAAVDTAGQDKQATQAGQADQGKQEDAGQSAGADCDSEEDELDDYEGEPSEVPLEDMTSIPPGVVIARAMEVLVGVVPLLATAADFARNMIGESDAKRISYAKVARYIKQTRVAAKKTLWIQKKVVNCVGTARSYLAVANGAINEQSRRSLREIRTLRHELAVAEEDLRRREDELDDILQAEGPPATSPEPEATLWKTRSFQKGSTATNSVAMIDSKVDDLLVSRPPTAIVRISQSNRALLDNLHSRVMYSAQALINGTVCGWLRDGEFPRNHKLNEFLLTSAAQPQQQAAAATKGGRGRGTSPAPTSPQPLATIANAVAAQSGKKKDDKSGDVKADTLRQRQADLDQLRKYSDVLDKMYKVEDERTHSRRDVHAIAEAVACAALGDTPCLDDLNVRAATAHTMQLRHSLHMQHFYTASMHTLLGQVASSPPPYRLPESAPLLMAHTAAAAPAPPEEVAAGGAAEQDVVFAAGEYSDLLFHCALRELLGPHVVELHAITGLHLDVVSQLSFERSMATAKGDKRETAKPAMAAAAAAGKELQNGYTYTPPLHYVVALDICIQIADYRRPEQATGSLLELKTYESFDEINWEDTCLRLAPHTATLIPLLVSFDAGQLRHAVEKLCSIRETIQVLQAKEVDMRAQPSPPPPLPPPQGKGRDKERDKAERLREEELLAGAVTAQLDAFFDAQFAALMPMVRYVCALPDALQAAIGEVGFTTSPEVVVTMEPSLETQALEARPHQTAHQLPAHLLTRSTAGHLAHCLLLLQQLFDPKPVAVPKDAADADPAKGAKSRKQPVK